jgi:hypothetical protein
MNQVFDGRDFGKIRIKDNRLKQKEKEASVKEGNQKEKAKRRT